MPRFFPRSITVTLLLVIPILLGGGNTAEAKDKHFLRGDFAFTVFRSCVQTGISPGFAADLSLLTNAFSRTTVLAGTLSYNRDGTGSAVYRFNNMNFANSPAGIPAGSFAVNGGETTCTIDNIVVNSDRSFTQDLTCSGFSDIGGGVGNTFSITGLMWEGQISRDRKVLTLHSAIDKVETIILTPPGTPRDRICMISGTALQDRRGRRGK